MAKLTRLTWGLTMLTSFTLLAASGCRAAEDGPALPAASWSQLPKWHGFNLLEKFMAYSNEPFREDDFRMIHELGFNFVRLPMDYRAWIVDGDWEKFNEQTLVEIDQAIEFGAKYGVHVMINFHRAPGYTVAQPPEAKSLWTDPEAQRVCALHWRTFARRYRDIPSDRVSFNLFNEPAGPSEEEYIAAVRPIVAAIREEDPDRLIVSDGLGWGRLITMGLLDLQIAQATRGYSPMQISHYQASWVGGSDSWPLPTWPLIAPNGLLTNPTKAGMSREAMLPLAVEGDLSGARKLRFTVGVVSDRANLVIRADGQPIWNHEFVSSKGTGEWQEERYVEQYNVYQNLWNRTYEIPLPAGAERLEMAVTGGDWLTVTRLGLVDTADKETAVDLINDWNKRPGLLQYVSTATGAMITCDASVDRETLWQSDIEPWLAWQRAGGGVMVGEFGAFNRTPHDVTMRWLEDLLTNWQRAGWGWAMWNFRGSFGILDSGREDVAYEDFQGHKLDRQMLDLLKRYMD